MLNVPILKALNIDQIIASCQLLQETDCVIFNTLTAQSCPEKEMTYRVFTPFSVDLTAKTHGNNRYIGGLEGFLFEYIPNYGTDDEPITFENLAAEYGDIDVADFALSILNAHGKLPCQWSTGQKWCEEKRFFALVSHIDIREEYKPICLEPFLVDNLYKIIQYDCCILIDSVFLPVAALAAKTKTNLRQLGFTRVGGGDNAYLVKHTNPQKEHCRKRQIETNLYKIAATH